MAQLQFIDTEGMNKLKNHHNNYFRQELSADTILRGKTVMGKGYLYCLPYRQIRVRSLLADLCS